ncbi:MAG: hypothetical protein AB1815_05855 [Bacillota bacterium]
MGQKYHIPPDIRGDVEILGGLRLTDLMYLLPAVVLGVLAAMLPLPAPLRLFFLVGLPLGTFLFLFWGLPAFIGRRWRYRREPEVRQGAELVEIIGVKDAEGAFLTFEETISLFISATPGPWTTLPAADRDQAGVAWAQMVGRVLEQGMSLDVWVVNDLQNLQSELNRQEKEQQVLPDGIAAVGAARRQYFDQLCQTGFSRTAAHFVRLSAEPDTAHLHPRPKSRGEKVKKTKQMLLEAAGDVIDKLAACGAQGVVLSAEVVVRDLAARQINPLTYRHGLDRLAQWPVLAEAAEKVDKPDDTDTAEERRAGVLGRLGKLRHKLRLPGGLRLPTLRKPKVPVLAAVWAGLSRHIYRQLYADRLNLLAVGPTDQDIPGLAALVNVLYKGFDTVNTTIWEYSPEDNAVPDEILRMMRAGYILVVYPAGHYSNKAELNFCVMVRIAAQSRGCKVDFGRLQPDGSIGKEGDRGI